MPVPLFITDVDTIPKGVHPDVVVAITQSIACGFVVGAKVTRTPPSEEVGVVVGYNTSHPSNLYGGSRYPIVVKFDSGRFEYGPESLHLREVPEDCTLIPYNIHQVDLVGTENNRIGVQDDISGRREYAYKHQYFRKQKQFNNGGPIPVEIGERWFGYIWADTRQNALDIALEMIN